jgi:hypothetical protein
MAELLTINPDSQNQLPLCPHCGKTIQELRYFTAMWTLTMNYIYACPHCLKVLGVSTA